MSAPEPSVRAVISDFGGVLTTPLMQSFLAYQERSGIALEDLWAAHQRAAEAYGANPLFALERGAMTEVEYLSRIEQELGGVKLERFGESFFQHLHPNEEMIGFLRQLKRRGLLLALLTNNVREWEPLWRAKLPDIDAIFDVVVDSAFVGMRKPEPAIYELTLERLGGLAADECVFVDDVDVNCQAARALGMRAVEFRDSEQAIAGVEAALRATPGD